MGDAGFSFESSDLDCADDAQRAAVLERQLTCCGGAETTEKFCPDYPVVSGASAATPEEIVQSRQSELVSGALIGICVGSAALACVVLLGIKMYMQRKRKREDWQTATAPKLTQSLELGSPSVPPTQSTTLDNAGMELDQDVTVLA